MLTVCVEWLENSFLRNSKSKRKHMWHTVSRLGRHAWPLRPNPLPDLAIVDAAKLQTHQVNVRELTLASNTIRATWGQHKLTRSTWSTWSIWSTWSTWSTSPRYHHMSSRWSAWSTSMSVQSNVCFYLTMQRAILIYLKEIQPFRVWTLSCGLWWSPDPWMGADACTVPGPSRVCLCLC